MVADTTQQSGRTAPKLDDLMLAMDVVDTLRHQHRLVEKELGQDERDTALKERLREIYENQGLEVSDRILQQGIEALRESRFTYEPRGSPGKRMLAMLWVRRKLFAGIAAALVIAVGIAFAGWWWQSSSERQAAEAQRIELTETLPRNLRTAADAALADARVPDAREEIQRILSAGAAALERKDATAARQAISDLDALRTKLSQTYDLVIVQSGQSGVFRIPDVNQAARNYYLIVEAIAPDGSKLSLPVMNEETGNTETVARWGVRVPETTFLSVKRDKEDDGIIQDRILGTKPRGALEPEFAKPVSGGTITKW